MIQSLHFRERNPLARTEWRSGQLGTSLFDDFQRLYDLGFDVGALAEDLDLLLSSTMLEHGTITAISLLSTGKALDRGLQAWYDKLSQKTERPMLWDAHQPFPDKFHHGGPSPEVPLTFRSHRIAELLTTFWTVRLLLLVAMLKLHKAISQSKTQTATSLEQNLVSDSHRQNASSQASLQPTTESSSRLLAPNPSPIHLHNLAVLIARSTAFCLSESVGQYGHLRFLFPLRVALVTFQNSATKLRNQYGPNNPNVREAERCKVWCQGCYETLAKDKQVGYARDLEKYPSRWQNPQD